MSTEAPNRPTRGRDILLFLSGGGAAGALIRAHDWAATPLGAPAGWPPALKTLVGVMLGSNQPMFVAWGPQRTMIYNDGYAELCRDRHPAALGAPFAQVWWDIMDDVGPILDRAFAGEATHMDDIEFMLMRDGRAQEAHFAFSYTPVRDESGAVGGLFCACRETTDEVLFRRQAATDTERYRRIFEETTDFIVATDLDQIITVCNPAAAAALGYTPDEVIGQSLAHFVGAEEFGRTTERLRAKLAGGGSTQYELMVHDKAGQPHLWEINSSLSRDGDGRPIGLHVLARDVSAARATQAALEVSEERLRLAVAGARVGLWDWDLATRRGWWSDRTFEIMGVEPSETVTPDQRLERVHPDDRETLRSQLEGALAAGGEFVHEYRALRPDGTVRHIASRGVIMRDVDGNAIRTAGSVIDVTEEREAEARLRASEEFNRRILESSTECIKVLSLDGIVEFMSQGGLCVMEVDDFGRVAGRCWTDLWPPEEHAKLVQAMDTARAGGTGRLQGAADTMKGNRRWWDVVVSPINGRDGRPEKLLSISRDITALKDAEEASRANESRLRRAHEAGGLGSYEWDIASGIGEQSESMLRMIGLEPDRAYSLKEVVATVLDEDRPQVLATVKAIADGAERAETDYRVRRADGEIRWIRDLGQLERAIDGQPVRWVGIVQDVTARKTAELALATNEERLRLVQKAGAIGSFDWDFRTGIVYRSPEYLALHGLPPEAADSAYSDRWFDRVHPDDRAAVEALHRETMKHPGDFANEHRIVRVSDGETRWISIRGTMLADEAGRPYRMLAAQTDVTERKRDEERLRASETRLRLVADALPVLVSYIDRDQRYRFVNKGYEDWFGLHRDEVHGRTMREVLGDAAYAVLRPHVEAALGGAKVDFEATAPYAAGGTRQIYANYIPQIADDGRVEGFYVLVADISERKAAEIRLRASEERLRLLAAAAPQLLWVAGADDRNEWVNERWNEFAGFDVTSEPRRWVELIHPDDMAAVVAAWETSRRNRAPFEFEFRLRRHDGVDRWHLSRALPFYDDDGKLLHWFGTLTDVEEQRRTADALRESEARLQLAQQAGGIGLWDWDVENDVAWWSDQLYDIVGLDRHAPRRVASFRALIHPDDRARTAAASQAVIDGEGNTIEQEFRIVRPDGETIWVASRGEVVRDADGRAVRMIGVNFDITGRKQIEEELRELTQVLEERVAEAVAERESVLAQLHEAQKLETLGQLTGGVAHDFNNLLTPIVGSLDLLRRRLPDDPRAARLIDGALQAAERAQTLVARLLAFGRRQLLQPQPVDVGDLLLGLTDLIQRSIGQHINVVVEPAPGLPPARVDPNQLELAVLNLAVNARDAMPGGGTLTIAALPETVGPMNEQRLRPGAYVRLSVIDTGMGMDEDTLKRAIEPFFTTKGVGKGTGLGLSMIHGLAGQLGGVLKLSSTVGIGTRADLWLPVAESAPVIEPDKGVEPLRTPAAAATVLLVDDEDLVRMGAAEMLTDVGYAVVEAASAADALRLIEAGQAADLLVTDYLMPGLNGGELIEAVRRHRPHLPALIVSGYANVEGLPADVPVLPKPFRHDEFAAQVAALIDAAKVVPIRRAADAAH